MNTADTSKLPKLLLVGVASATLAIGASATVSAIDRATDRHGRRHDRPHEADTRWRRHRSPSTARPRRARRRPRRSARPSVAAEAAFASEDPALIGPAVEALTAAAPADVAAVGRGVSSPTPRPGPATRRSTRPMRGMIEYDAAPTAASPSSTSPPRSTPSAASRGAAGRPDDRSLENIGEEVHEVVIMRINDDVTLSVEEILALPEEECSDDHDWRLRRSRTASRSTSPGATWHRRRPTCSAWPLRRRSSSLPAARGLDARDDRGRWASSGRRTDGRTAGRRRSAPPHFTLGMVQEFTVA